MEDKKTRRDFFKSFLIYASIFAIFLDSLRTITKAAQNDYEIVLYYNHYGEGIYELIMFYIVLVLGVYFFYYFYKVHVKLDLCIKVNKILKDRLITKSKLKQLHTEKFLLADVIE